MQGCKDFSRREPVEKKHEYKRVNEDDEVTDANICTQN